MIRLLRNTSIAAVLAAVAAAAAAQETAAEFWRAKATEIRAQGDLEKASAATELALRSVPMDPDLSIMSIELLETLGQKAELEKKVALYRAGMEHGPAIALYPYLLSLIEKDPVAKQKLARQAIAADAGSPWGYYGLAQALTAAAAPAAEIETNLRKAVELDPQSGRFLDSLGRFLLESGKRGEARARFSEAIQVDAANASRYALSLALAAEPGEGGTKGPLYTALGSVWRAYPASREAAIAAAAVASAADADWAKRQEAFKFLKQSFPKSRELARAATALLNATFNRAPTEVPKFAAEMVAHARAHSLRPMLLEGYTTLLRAAATKRDSAAYAALVKELENIPESPSLYEQIAIEFLDYFSNPTSSETYLRRALAALTPETLAAEYAAQLDLTSDRERRLATLDREVRALMNVNLVRAQLDQQRFEQAAQTLGSIPSGIASVEPLRLAEQGKLEEAQGRPAAAMESLLDAWALRPRTATRAEIDRLAKRLGVDGDLHSRLVSAARGRARRAMPLALVTGDGKPLSSAALAGKVSVFAFWGSWCNPCSAELSALSAGMRQIEAKLKERTGDIKLYAVVMDQDRAAAATVTARFPRFTALFPRDRAAVAEMGVGSLPRLLVVGKDGQLYYDQEAGILDPEIANYLEILLSN